MQCYCIKGSGFDFYIKVIDTQTIVFNNLSEWVDDEPNIIPTTHVVKMTLPDASTLSVQLNALGSTVIIASDIGLSKFKDGIYCFTIEPLSDESGGCGNEQTKSVGIFPNIRCCIDTAYSTLDEDKFPQVKDVENWIRFSELSSELGKEKQALDEYKVAKRLLSKLNCECNC